MKQTGNKINLQNFTSITYNEKFLHSISKIMLQQNSKTSSITSNLRSWMHFEFLQSNCPDVNWIIIPSI